jgi:hypothetical protein
MSRQRYANEPPHRYPATDLGVESIQRHFAWENTHGRKLAGLRLYSQHTSDRMPQYRLYHILTVSSNPIIPALRQHQAYTTWICDSPDMTSGSAESLFHHRTYQAMTDAMSNDVRQ